MLFAATDDISQMPSLLAQQIFWVEAILLFPAVYVFWRLLRRISTHGPQVRHDLFATPETLVGIFILMAYFWIVLQLHFPLTEGPALAPSTKGHEMLYAETPVPMALKERLFNGMINAGLFPVMIVGVLLFRGARVSDHFGLAKLGFWKTLGMGAGLGLLAMVLIVAVNFIVMLFIRQDQQSLIQSFQSAVSDGDGGIMFLIGFSALAVAPIAEEILFRGTFYPVLARGLGRIPSALICAALFGLLHDGGAPSLAFLALLLTLAYEATGSLLVPIVMHIVFNSLNLLLLWWNTSQGGL